MKMLEESVKVTSMQVRISYKVTSKHLKCIITIHIYLLTVTFIHILLR